MRGALPFLLGLTLCASAWAGSAVEDRRAAATQARAQLDALSQEQSLERTELDGLSARIEALKAQHKRSATAELESDLRRSQALSDRLAVLAKEVSDAQDAVRQSDLTLLSAIDAELEADRKAWSGADRAGREQLIAAMRALRTERETVRARLPQAQLPSVAPAASDDPTALLEQADALRDSEDKVRRRLAELDARITEAKRERELDRRMSEVSGDESMFDEQDRSLRLTRTSSGNLAVDRPSGTGTSDGTATPTAGGPMAGGPLGSGGPTPPVPPPEPHASDHQPQLAGPTAPATVGDDLGSLEQERARLQQMAQSLEAQAKSAEQMAHAAP